MIDTHCHLTDIQYAPDLQEVLARARAAGVTPMVTIADEMPDAEKGVALAETISDVYSAIGVHPHRAKDWKASDAAMLKALAARSKKVVAIGEIGLDFHYDHSPREVQKEVFRAQLQVARDLNLPIVIHCRDAVADVRAIVEEVNAGPFVIHCCSETWDDIAWVVESGNYLSFTGIATFPKGEVIRDTAKRCPLTSLMVETDAPYLAPVPYRGQRCEPMHVMETARFLADLKGVSLEEFDAVTTKTAMAFFRLPS